MNPLGSKKFKNSSWGILKIPQDIGKKGGFV
jgi:hypothetical protein